MFLLINFENLILRNFSNKPPARRATSTGNLSEQNSDLQALAKWQNNQVPSHFVKRVIQVLHCLKVTCQAPVRY